MDKQSTMLEVPKAGTLSADLEAQRAYVKEVEAKGFDFNLVVADAFVRGMRDIGYKSSSWALCELVDNAVQAEAKNVHVAFSEGKEMAAIAVVDDGHGMDPEMVRLAAVWGGSHRTKSTSGFGKYGYGLPSASVSQARRFTVYSLPEGGAWHHVGIDVDEIMDGRLTKGHKIEVPPAEEGTPPDWVQKYIKKHFGDLSHGTVVLLEKLDRVRPKTAAGLQNDLLEHFGVIYRNFLKSIHVSVNGVRVEPVDPLFLTPGYRYYDLDDERAVALDPLAFTVDDKKTGKPLGTVKVRYASMPPGFARIPEDKMKPKGGKNNARFKILDENNGLIILREGRQIDVVRSNRARRFSVNNDDRYWGVEIDFPASLDDEFSITTSKQQVRLHDRIWDLLEATGVFQVIAELRGRYDDATADLKVKIQEAAKRASETVMEEAQKFKTRKPEGDEAEIRRESEEEIKKEAQRRAQISGLPEPEVERQLRSQQEGRAFIVEFETLPGAPFYRIVRRGGPKVLYINTAHRFYTKLYAPAEDPQLRAALELLLWALGETELDAEPGSDRRRFYEEERHEWSRRLNILLDILDKTDGATGLTSVAPPPPQQATAAGA